MQRNENDIFLILCFFVNSHAGGLSLWNHCEFNENYAVDYSIQFLT